MLYSTPQLCLATSQCCTAAAMTKLNIRNVDFHCDSLAILWGRKTRLLQVYTYKTCSEARLLQDTQGVRTANDRARTHAFCPQMQHNRAATLRFIARLPQESYEPYEYPWSSHDCPPAVLAIALQLCKHIWRQPCVWTQDKRASIVRMPYVSENLHEVCNLSWQNGRTIDVKQAISIID